MKRIALIGTHGVGKTIIFEELKKAHIDYSFFSEGVRHQVTALGYKNPYEIVDEVGIGAFELFNINSWSVIDKTNTLLKEDSVIITDRSAVDNYAYFLTLKKTETDEMLNPLLLKAAKHYAGLIDLFIYFPIKFKLVGDDMRPDDVDLQQRVDKNIHLALEILGIPKEKIYNLNNDSVQERVVEINQVIDALS